MNLPLDFQLLTARCRLRAPREADLPHVFAATRYAGFNDGMRWDPPATDAELKLPHQQSIALWQAAQAFTFTIETRHDAAFVGRIAIRSTPLPRVWDIGFWLHPAEQGRGLMTEAARAVIDSGFNRLGAEAIEACHATWNTRSRRVLERVGMREVEYLPQGFQKRGEWVPEYRMRVVRPVLRPNASGPTADAAPIQ